MMYFRFWLEPEAIFSKIGPNYFDALMSLGHIDKAFVILNKYFDKIIRLIRKLDVCPTSREEE